MKFKSIIDPAHRVRVAVELNDQWQIINEEVTLLELLDKSASEILNLELAAVDLQAYQEVIPFRPAAYRDFMLYEKHAIDAARGFVKKYLSKLYPIVRTYEKLLGKPFPKLKPKSRYYQHPIYYMGNHLNIISHQESIAIPSYTKELDYELELAAVITKPLKNASIDEVNEAIGGFLILNDFSARDVQLDEMESGFGPMKTKNFGSAISSVVVAKEDLLHRLEALKVSVSINDETIVEGTTEGKLYSFQEAIAYASWEEQLHPGELFGSGTIPGCTGIENGVMLKAGDQICLTVEGIGSLNNTIQ
ncbi:MAG: fumarylacetoacetate hydrolase family protein [Saprospiraceae bacterium]|nr:fumarylacetoacetate hydrolase family protein [Saprospiraceae bacterium]